MHRLSADDLGKRFGHSWVFRGLTFSVSDGESLAVTGRNGSGKSTLLRMLSGLMRPTHGNVSLNNGGAALDTQAHIQSVGYLSPTLNFYNAMSAIENLRLIVRLRGLDLSDTQLEQLLTRVGLKNRGQDLVGGYSSGMQQRLRIASVLIHDPPVLLLDEPFTNLDPDGFAVVEEMLTEQIRGGRIVVVATNSADEARLCSASIAIPES